MNLCLVLYEFALSGRMATEKPEVVINMRRGELEMQFFRQFIGFRGRQIRGTSI